MYELYAGEEGESVSQSNRRFLNHFTFRCLQDELFNSLKKKDNAPDTSRVITAKPKLKKDVERIQLTEGVVQVSSQPMAESMSSITVSRA